jgi:RHS repeat-associated protein
LIDNSGNIVAKYEYSPFGKQTVASGTYADNPFRFSTEYFDTETGLVYFIERYYIPELGRWSKRDSIGFLGGYNLYEMLMNDSINKWDYLGFSAPNKYCDKYKTFVEGTDKIADSKCPKDRKELPMKKFQELLDEANAEGPERGALLLEDEQGNVYTDYETHQEYNLSEPYQAIYKEMYNMGYIGYPSGYLKLIGKKWFKYHYFHTHPWSKARKKLATSTISEYLRKRGAQAVSGGNNEPSPNDWGWSPGAILSNENLMYFYHRRKNNCIWCITIRCNKKDKTKIYKQQGKKGQNNVVIEFPNGKYQSE